MAQFDAEVPSHRGFFLSYDQFVVDDFRLNEALRVSARAIQRSRELIRVARELRNQNRRLAELVSVTVNKVTSFEVRQACKDDEKRK